MVEVAGFIADALKNFDNETELSRIRDRVHNLMRRFPLYAQRLR
jgi:glycine hydroxymethyltransferase